MGRPDVPIRIRGGIVQISCKRTNNQAIVAITADMSRCRTPYPCKYKILSFQKNYNIKTLSYFLKFCKSVKNFYKIFLYIYKKKDAVKDIFLKM